jgi:capsular polysaccharide biosynthesis protein
MREEVVILNLLKNLRKRLSLILSITFLSIASVWILLEYVIAPDFQATSQIWVEGLADGEAAENQPDPLLVEAYGDIVKSEEVLEGVIIELGLPYTVLELHEQIAVNHAANPQVLNITVNNPNSKEAVEIANTLTVILQEALMDWLETDDITVITQASEELAQSSLDKNTIFDLGLAGAFGLIVGTLIAFILEMLNTLSKQNKRVRGRGRRKKEETNLQTVFK